MAVTRFYPNNFQTRNINFLRKHRFESCRRRQVSFFDFGVRILENVALKAEKSMCSLDIDGRPPIKVLGCPYFWFDRLIDVFLEDQTDHLPFSI